MEYRELSQIGVEPERIGDRAYRIRLTSNNQSQAIMEGLVREYSLNPRIRELVAELLKGCKSKDFDCYIGQIVNFVKENVKYVNDPPRAEVFQSPIKTLEYGMGDCDDHAVLTATLLRAAGFEARPVIRKVNDRWGHVVVSVFHPVRRQWIEIDTTEGEMVDNAEVYELGYPEGELLNEEMEEVYELGLDGVEGELPDEGIYELGRSFSGRRWILVNRRGRLYREFWQYRNNRRIRLLRRVAFSGNRWIVRKVPLHRNPNSPIVYYKELWQYRGGRPVRRLRRVKWKVVRPHRGTPHHTHPTHHRAAAHTEAGMLSKSTLPLLLGAGALVWLLKRK